jgi:hypothetical protein
MLWLIQYNIGRALSDRPFSSEKPLAPNLRSLAANAGACSEALDARRDEHVSGRVLEVCRANARRSNDADEAYQQAPLRTRVGFVIYLFQMIARNMSVYLSGRYIGMAKHFLNRAQISAIFKQMSSKGMT